ncbi:ankyrin repeat domain-containing protein [Aspergillus lucknowensis]|uniref:Ankyrin repeat-containing domain protein n=1 Tax=Aspergillus lucknowensis TaxID=176173 RepID=A0ABR4L8W1_9EURO
MKYLREVRDGLHESSVLNLVPEDEVIDKKMNWEKFRRELGELNITPAVLEEHKAFIQAIMRRAKQMGDLDTEIPSEPDSETRAMSEDLDRRYEQRAVDMEQLRNKSQHVDSKKSTPLVALGLRALRIVSDERLIEAADEGKLDRVVSLLRRRVNVNASDKWRWTALHMAAYGGYNDIAQVLIAAGADLNARTVDGETPLKLAERNRHIDVVCTISDEVERRREDLERQTAQNTTATTGDGEK